MGRGRGDEPGVSRADGDGGGDQSSSRAQKGAPSSLLQLKMKLSIGWGLSPSESVF